MIKIISFLEKNHIFTLATANRDLPYCATCFYVFDKENFSLIFASEISSTHIQQAIKNPKVAGAIAFNTLKVAKIQGIQFKGELKTNLSKRQKELYISRFPLSLALNPTFWQIEISWIKFTDNTLGFKNKTIWKR